MTVGLTWLPQTAFLFLLIFARVGSILMLLPALGEQAIPAQMRLTFALAFTLVLLPLLSETLPKLPDGMGPIGVLLLHEVAVGLVLGAITRFIVLATEVAGAIIAFQTGLSVAQGADPSQSGIQGAVLGNFLSMLGITMIFATDLHHLALSAIVGSYRMIAPTDPLMFSDALQLALKTIAGAFVLGTQMAAPFIVYGLVFNVGIGILARLMPALQVYFLATSANIWVGLVLFALLLTMMMGWYLTHVQAQFALLGGG
ncbi:MAG: flagellar biosynthetic protein FliR [Devosia sp.]|nr:flagellar biosynthetic protein FliR [Devosia sp.]